MTNIANITKQIRALEAQKAAAEADTVSKTALLFPDVTYTAAGKEKKMDTSANAEVLFSAYGVQVTFNEMSRKIEIETPGLSLIEDTKFNVQLNWLRERARKHELPDTNIVEYVDIFAARNNYHPVRDWINSKPWDGVDRIPAWLDTITTDHPMKRTLMIKWATSAVAAVQPGRDFNAEGVLILIGDQGLGKTSWMFSLFPDSSWGKEGASLDPNNKDSVMQATRYWITELGELNKLFRKAEIEDLKNFITKSEDNLRPPYARVENAYPRRTIFFGTSNEHSMLVDDENRRYWTMDVTAINYNHDIDMQQFWAQIKEQFYDKGAEWWLTPTERANLNKNQVEHRAPNPIEELMSACVSMPVSKGKYTSTIAEAIGRKVEDISGQSGEKLNVTAILMKCGVRSPKIADVKSAANWLRNNGFEMCNKAKKEYHVVIEPLKIPDNRASGS